MDKIYEHSDDVHVRNTVVYLKVGDTYAYADKACTQKVDVRVLNDLFVKGLLISDGTTTFRPLNITTVAVPETEGYAVVTYVKADGVDPTKAVLTLMHSAEYVAG